MDYFNIDFGTLYRQHMARAGGRDRTPADWDARAAGMRKGIFAGTYVDGFVARMRLDADATLLDVGCGPGTIALTLAPRLAHVYGIDYSPGMLTAFDDEARARGITNATSLLRGWDDDWSDIPRCDIVVASRSSQLPDLEAALTKLDAHAIRRVYLTHLVGGRFVPPAVAEALGRDDEPLPDYIYAVNILRQRGIHPTIDYLEGDNRFRNCVDADDFVRKIRWSAGELSSEEEARLRTLYAREGRRIGNTPMLWALIAWEKP